VNLVGIIKSIGTQTWDVEFAIQAILASGLTREYASTLRKAHDFLKASQVFLILSQRARVHVQKYVVIFIVYRLISWNELSVMFD